MGADCMGGGVSRLRTLPPRSRASSCALLLVGFLLPQGLQEDPLHLAQGLVVHAEVLLLPTQGTAQGVSQDSILLHLDGQPRRGRGRRG